MSTATSDESWESYAVCRHHDPDLWFSRRTAATAIAICRTCPVLPACRTAMQRREDGLPPNHRQGIVAGLTPSQRYRLERTARRRPVPVLPPDPVPRTRKTHVPAPCGTRAAYQRHLRRREPVDEACRAANARSAGHYRRTGSTRT
ncbi:WhiB family transcriptional regulator [Streptomyces sp. NPDC001260]|uniref:WhiB family transcriptional regulator n=1 Tax=Streptomyces sp. NPDC001260 TaxID=3364551 RepID=UPI0036A50C2F